PGETKFAAEGVIAAWFDEGRADMEKPFMVTLARLNPRLASLYRSVDLAQVLRPKLHRTVQGRRGLLLRHLRVLDRTGRASHARGHRGFPQPVPRVEV